VILKVIATNICGSDQHMVRGRTNAAPGLVLGHEMTGEVIEKGRDVECINIGDLVSVPFNVACGSCTSCREQQTALCLTTNPPFAGAAYGFADMGGWTGGQTEYVLVPFADFNLLKFPDKEQAVAKIQDLTMLSDILPTGFHAAVNAGVDAGSIVYIAGAGPVGFGGGLRPSPRGRRSDDRRYEGGSPGTRAKRRFLAHRLNEERQTRRPDRTSDRPTPGGCGH